MQSSYTIKVGSYRGDISDCSGNQLVNCEQLYYAALTPDFANNPSIQKYLSTTQKSTLKTGFPIVVKVDKNFHSQDIKVFPLNERYPKTPLCTHIIGYTDDNGGVCGIEKSYNDILSADDVNIVFKQDAHGKTLCGIEPQITKSGKSGSVTLTIDRNIQAIAQSAAERYIKTGAVLVIDNTNGKIRAICSVPDYNPYNVADSLNDSCQPLINRALLPYSTGSVFKLCIAASALESGCVKNAVCNGKIKIGNVTFNCLKKHGEMSLETAIAYSCNVYFISLGQVIGSEKAYKTAKMMGFCAENTLAPFITDAKGSLNSEQDLKNNPAALGNFSFGQGNVMTTPLQVASMVQCIANFGRRIRPTLIESVTNKNGEKSVTKPISGQIVMSEKNAEILKKCMLATVEYGTGSNVKCNGISCGGKTATAQTGKFDKFGREYLQAWFAGFAEKNSRSYTIVVMAENGVSGGQSAAPVFREIAEKIF